jgi:sugar O-acyltransferase (sialic acid O-acetyltransferase NeuD family)
MRLILGDGQHAHEVAEYLKDATSYEYSLVGREEEDFYLRSPIRSLVLGTGFPVIRKEIFERWEVHQSAFDTFINKFSHVSPSVDIGQGCYISIGVIIATGANIGNGVLANWNVSIGHNSTVSDFCVIAPGAVIGGAVNLGEAVYIGSNATILPGLNIGAGAVIGAGTVITRDVKENTIMVGNRARDISRN